jgi:hypothetical protein
VSGRSERTIGQVVPERSGRTIGQVVPERSDEVLVRTPTKEAAR